MADNEKMRRVQLYLTNEQHNALKRLAKRRGVSMAQVMRDAVSHYIEWLEEHPLLKYAGALKGTDPSDSVNHDDIIYGKDDYGG